MELIEVKPFTDLPIQFKEINYSDFIGFKSDGNKKTILTPNKDGYVTDEIIKNIDIEKSNTTIINACVGQGKSTAIIKLISQLQGNQDYVVVLVAPYKALLKQYDKLLTKAGIKEDEIYNYENLETDYFYDEDIKKPIHLLSVHVILGNPGQIAMIPKNIKRNYISQLISYCETKNKKMVFVFDEIHDAIHVFKQNLIFNLFKWRNVTHKIIVSSATFNEASKVVIKYFGELTNKKIHILESKRKQVPKKVSDLFLCFYDRYNYDVNNQYFKELFLNQINESDSINILSYSKKLAKQIYNSEIGDALKQKFGNVNLCTGDTGIPYEENQCNIGTNFKTGINIDDENTSFFIILPPKSTYIQKLNKFGIFIDGIFTIIQAFARPRKKAKIFIITSSPDRLILNAKNNNEDFIKKTSLGYFPFNLKDFQAPFIDINVQDSLFQRFYSEEKRNVQEEIKHIESSDMVITPMFDEYDVYKLQESERYYRTYYDIFGKNLSNYVYWAAWNNQFVNCKLQGIIKTSALFFEEGKLQSALQKHYISTYFDDSYFNFLSDRDSYFTFRGSLFSSIIYLKEKDKDLKKILPYRNSTFEKSIITYIQKIKKQANINFLEKLYPKGMFSTDGKINKSIDYTFDVEEYIRINMANATSLFDKNQNTEEAENRLINAYTKLYEFKDILLKHYSTTLKNGSICLPTNSKIELKEEHIIPLQLAIEDIVKYDEPLKSFSFLQKKSNNINSIYGILKNVFFETKLTTIDKGKLKLEKIIKENPLPNSEDFVNLIYNYETSWLSSPSYTILP